MSSVLKRLLGRLGRVLAAALRACPEWLRIQLGRALGWVWFDVLRVRRRVAIENVQLAYPELSRVEATSLARKSIEHMGRGLIEFALFPGFTAAEAETRFVFEGEGHMRSALAQGRGVLMLSLHLGNGDFTVAALSRRGYKINLISKLFRAQWLNDLWFGMRAAHGTRFIAPEKSSFEILKSLRRGEIVAFVLDQYMGPPIGCRTRFFGRETGTAMGLAIMAERTGAPVVPSYTYRLDDGRHVCCFEAPIPWNPDVARAAQDQGPDGDAVAAMTQVYTSKIEEIIRRHPEQWMWIHRRWKKFA
jgi:KDO2-lipid IV(A) lauroyltransferase